MATNNIQKKLIQRDFQRQLYCILGIPIDAISLTSAQKHITDAIEENVPSFLSTPNLNFFIQALEDYEFTRSIVESDISIADGQPLCWIAQFLDTPITERVAGSSLFERLSTTKTSKPLRIFFFGGQDNVAKEAMYKLNKTASGVVGVGAMNPGMGTVDDMSSKNIVDSINKTKPDFVVVALGAKKGQEWILKNREKLNAKVISHLGAVVNFTAGNIQRAPNGYQQYGLEWLWRIKEEPNLWSRYWKDGISFLRVIFKELIPYKWYLSKLKKSSGFEKALDLSFQTDPEFTKIVFSGAITESQIDTHRKALADIAETKNRKVKIDLQAVTYIDPCSLGIILLLEKYLGERLSISHASSEAEQILKFNRMLRLLPQR